MDIFQIWIISKGYTLHAETQVDKMVPLQKRDQFDNLEKHTQWGIEFVEKYTKFVKERSEIETNYAKQIRNLSKKYQPKKSSREDEENKYTSCRAFLMTLNELNDYAGQHEVIAENLTSQIIAELTRYLQEVKTERKSHFHDGRKAQQHVESSWKQLESCKRRFERDCKEADRAQQYFEKMDADINVTKADVEKRSSLKARQQAQMRQQMATDSKGDYSSYLQKFNQEQNEHYFTIIPNIFQKLQEMEEKRIERIGVSMKTFADVDRQVLPIVGKCLDGMTKAAESIEPKTDSNQVVESYKSGFEPPGDVEFEDYGQAMKRTVSETSLSNSREGKEKPAGKSKGKLWPFIKNKNKLMSLLTSPHQPPTRPPSLIPALTLCCSQRPPVSQAAQGAPLPPPQRLHDLQTQNALPPEPEARAISALAHLSQRAHEEDSGPTHIRFRSTAIYSFSQAAHTQFPRPEYHRGFWTGGLQSPATGAEEEEAAGKARRTEQRHSKRDGPEGRPH
ncbi:formin-binding protein 1 isoform X12 [Embiotoca jacksoni]|uniref:formin-binding protein 1 isoform X12 n=1 Tax=Embiotoca jacksoni TaxID=100190 RepID=UPI003703DC89